MRSLKTHISVITVIILLLISMSGCGSTNKIEASPAESQTPTAAATPTNSTAPTAEVTATANQGYNKGDVMPDFSFNMIDKNTFKLSEHSGKIVFINLFATWCQPCMNEMPDIQKLYQKYGDKIDFIAIDVGGEDISADTAFAKNKSFSFQIANSPDGSFGSYEVQFIPQTFILGTDGKIEYYFNGQSDYATFSGAFDKLLNK